MKKPTFTAIVSGFLWVQMAHAEPSQAQIDMLNQVMAEHAEAEAQKPAAALSNTC